MEKYKISGYQQGIFTSSGGESIEWAKLFVGKSMADEKQTAEYKSAGYKVDTFKLSSVALIDDVIIGEDYVLAFDSRGRVMDLR